MQSCTPGRPVPGSQPTPFLSSFSYNRGHDSTPHGDCGDCMWRVQALTLHTQRGFHRPSAVNAPLPPFGLTCSLWLNGLRHSVWTLPLSPSKPTSCTSHLDSSPSLASLCSLTWPSTTWPSRPLRTSWSRRPRVASPDTSRASLGSGANQALPGGQG